MIKFFREEKKYFIWSLWAVIAVFVLYVFLDFGRTGGGSGSVGDFAAVIGDRTISKKEFFDEYRARERQYSQMFKGGLSPELRRNMNLPKQVLSELVDRALLRKEADRMGLTVSDEELGRHIVSDPNFQQNGVFIGEQRYRAILEANGYTTIQYETMVRDGLLLQRLNRLLERSISLTDQVLEEEFRRRNDKATVEFVFVPTAAEEGMVAPTPQEVQAAYDATREDYRAGERRQVKYLLVDLGKIRATMNVTDADARADYDQHASDHMAGEQVHARHILVKAPEGGDRTAARAKAQGILAQAQGGADFAKLAKEFSEDAGSAVNGGDLGFFSRGQMVGPFDEAAFSGEPGKVVNRLVETTFGFHIIQVLERRAPRQRPFEEVAPEIKARLANLRAEGEAERRAKDLGTRAAAATGDDALRNMAEATGIVTFNTTEFFGREDDVPGIGRSPEFQGAVFGLKKGEVMKEPVKVPRGWVVGKLAEIREPGIAPLEEVRGKAEAAARRRKAQDAAIAKVKAALAVTPIDKGLGPLGKALGVEAKTPPEIARNGSIEAIPGGAKSFVAEIFRSKGGELVGPVAVTGGGVAVAKILSRTAFDPAAFEAQKEQLRESLRQQESSRLLQSLLGILRTKEKVRINDELVEQLLRG
jgi:peptidyl-prolyl cis-trans isomerase D